MSKALTLALALAAGQARADGLVVSALFGTEPPSYVHAAVANVLGFTLPTTKIVVQVTRNKSATNRNQAVASASTTAASGARI